ncbi:class I SAM-dependent methyltransferase [Saccharopolyspora sp. CA-218241]|uniref:class I SAM-dependent methyltransferase n=1 Tax=Saccharopolyspora sp. CA-218241 TaxID=3240027 RepID=UPI003D972127
MTRHEDARPREAFAAADFAALGEHLWDPIGADTTAAADPRPGQRVLDACCGTGASALPAARLVGAEGVVDAVDVSASMVDELRRRATGLPQLRTHRADVTTWDGTGYDVVQSALGIFFFPDMAAGTRRLIGMTRPGGRVVFTIWRAGAMAAAGEQLGRAVADLTASTPRAREPHLFDRINRPAPFAAWLAGLGMSEVDVAMREHSLPMTPELAWLVVLGSGFRGALTGLDPEDVALVRDRYLGHLRAEGIDDLDATTLIATGTAPRTTQP